MLLCTYFYRQKKAASMKFQENNIVKKAKMQCRAARFGDMVTNQPARTEALQINTSVCTCIISFIYI